MCCWGVADLVMHCDEVQQRRFDQLTVEEEVARSVLVTSCDKDAALLDACIADGLYFFANNERTRRTFFKLQDDVASRAPSHAPKSGEWDYHLYFLSRDEYARKNPFRRRGEDGSPGARPPGIETSTVENPAREYYADYVQKQLTAAANAKNAISHNPLLSARQQQRAVQVLERDIRRSIELLRDEFLTLCRGRRDRCRHFTLVEKSPSNFEE